MNEGYGSIECDNLTASFSSCDNYEKSTPTNDDDSKASTFQTIINMIKMCIGTGSLALPFAADQGGLLFYAFGLAIVTLWNIYSTDRLLKCSQYMNEYKIERDNARTSLQYTSFIDEKFNSEETDASDSKNTSTFGKVTLFAFGKVGLQFVDTMMMALMFGITIAYEDAFLCFIGDTPLTSGSKNLDAFCMLLIVIPLALLSDFGLIAKISALGTFTIFSVFLLIGYFGVHENGLAGFGSISEQRMWPTGFTSFSSWYGIAAFGMGTVPFTFNLQESMRNPNQMMKATNAALWVVFATYVSLGILLSIIFWPTLKGFHSDILSALPHNSLLSSAVKLSMSIVIISSIPLIIVPFGDLLQQKLGLHRQWEGATVRISICIVCALVSISVPNFVYVISFIGCFCVAFISYTFPAVAHIFCLFKLRDSRLSFSKAEWRQIYVDAMLLPVGLISCLMTSDLTFKEMLKGIQIAPK